MEACTFCTRLFCLCKKFPFYIFSPNFFMKNSRKFLFSSAIRSISFWRSSKRPLYRTYTHTCIPKKKRINKPLFNPNAFNVSVIKPNTPSIVFVCFGSTTKNPFWLTQYFHLTPLNIHPFPLDSKSFQVTNQKKSNFFRFFAWLLQHAIRKGRKTALKSCPGNKIMPLHK